VRKEGSQGTLVTPAKKKKLEKPYRNSRIIFFNEIIIGDLLEISGVSG
jgi:hypothetical protein